jgi:hypothetical protein
VVDGESVLIGEIGELRAQHRPLERRDKYHCEHTQQLKL